MLLWRVNFKTETHELKKRKIVSIAINLVTSAEIAGY
jgi:hypothetical protein